MPTKKKPVSTHSKKAAESAKPTTAVAAPTESSEKSTKSHKRSRSGCYTCRLRRKKCDEGQPICRACSNLCVKCDYKRPLWWSNSEQRRIQKERVKNKIKQTKLNEKRASQPGATRAVSMGSPFSGDYDFNRPLYPEPYDHFSSHLPTPVFGQTTFNQLAPYEVDIKTERQTFINDIPMRHDSSNSTFTTFAPPHLHTALPTFPTNDLFNEEYLDQPPPYTGMNDALFENGSSYSYSSLQSTIPVDDRDLPLLNHFIDNVLRLIYPILEVHQRGHARTQAILQSLESNKSYLHCCLSVSAIHLKTTTSLGSEEIDHDIVRHRYEAVSQLCQALNRDTDHDQILEAALAMIFFHCSVGPPDDYLPDIPWYDHFQAVTNLVNKLDLPTIMESSNLYTPPPFNMALTSWIDILGSTMLGKTPQFAHTYRNMHLSGASSGLRELMGCEDRVMYLISEIACLDALKAEGRMDDMTVCSHVSALGRQLEYTEPADQTLEDPYSIDGAAIRPEQLTKSMTAVFRIAARIYLCSLVPGFDRNQQSNINLVAAVAETLQYIPAGPEGFDRSLVWPLLITGAFSVPSSPFRSILHERVALLGDNADFGSFGRMYRLLQEVWRLTDDPIMPEAEDTISLFTDPALKKEKSPSPSIGTPPGMREIKKQPVHWRDVMNRNGWRYLLI